MKDAKKVKLGQVLFICLEMLKLNYEKIEIIIWICIWNIKVFNNPVYVYKYYSK